MNRLARLSLAGAAAALLLAPVVRAAEEAPAAAPAPEGAMAADADAKTIWAKKCAGCHNENGDGDTKMGKKNKVEDMTPAAWQKKHGDDVLRKAITEGVPDTKMKAYKDKLSAAQIDALVAHIRTFKPKS